MAEALTYDSLVQDIKDYSERSDEPFLNQIPRLIMMAENRIASESKPFGFVRTVTGTLNGNTLEKPTRWRKTKSFSLLDGTTRRYLYSREYEYCRSFWPNAALTALPKYYADYDYEHFFLAATPDQAYPFELQYYERPIPLSAENQTNWTTQYAPQLLLYATMMEAMPFLKTSERIPEFQGLYDRAMAAITKEDESRVMDSAVVRSQP
jgi:hypothetical protein